MRWFIYYFFSCVQWSQNKAVQRPNWKKEDDSTLNTSRDIIFNCTSMAWLTLWLKLLSQIDKIIYMAYLVLPHCFFWFFFFSCVSQMKLWALVEAGNHLLISSYGQKFVTFIHGIHDTMELINNTMGLIKIIILSHFSACTLFSVFFWIYGKSSTEK